ncbi:MAG TPA: DUF2905 family protein [Anaeromyxobacteraceae bacterium]|nr:DUF2905 family protein [Anaeromyxobacteraceae bacterium]
MAGLGKLLLVAAAVLAVLGLLLVAAERFPALRIGRLPGDFSFGRGSWRVYFPLATSILLSIVLSLVLWLFSRRG